MWLLDLDRGTRERFTFELTTDGLAWSADSRELFYTIYDKAGSHMYRKPVNGGGAQLVMESPLRIYVSDMSYDGKYILFEQPSGHSPATIWVAPLFGKEKPRPLITDTLPSGTHMARFSPANNRSA